MAVLYNSVHFTLLILLLRAEEDDKISWAVGDRHPFRVVLGWAYCGLTDRFLLLQNFSVAISVSPHVCFILVLILISVFLR